MRYTTIPKDRIRWEFIYCNKTENATAEDITNMFCGYSGMFASDCLGQIISHVYKVRRIAYAYVPNEQEIKIYGGRKDDPKRR